MTKSMMEAEALLFWKISRDLNLTGLSQNQRREIVDEMEGFAMNAHNARLRHMAAASLEALASSIRAEAGPKPGSSAAPATPALAIDVTCLTKRWEELRIVAPVSFTKRIRAEFLDLVLAEEKAAAEAKA